jgi:hypothetical protein
MAIRIIVANLGKIIAAGIIAFLIVNAFCLAYHTYPVLITSKTGITDSVWERHNYYSLMTEGFGYGRTNNEGFNNLEDYNSQPIDILLMGSSHMEAFNVAQTKTTVALLNNKFNKSKYVYNIGIQNHDFPHIMHNLETALLYYTLRENVIIEIVSTQFDMASLKDIIELKIQPIPSHDKDTDILFNLRKISYLRLLSRQYRAIRDNSKAEIHEQISDVFDKEKYSELLDRVMQHLNQISINNNIKPIIFYHPYLFPNKDGSAFALSLNALFLIKDGSASVNTDNEYLNPLLDLSKFWHLVIFFVEAGVIAGLAYTGANPFIYFQF